MKSRYHWLWTLILSSAVLLAHAAEPLSKFGSSPHPTALLWFEFDDALKYLLERPLSLGALIVVIVGVTKIWSEIKAERTEMRKKLGLVPIHELTEEEKDGMVVTSAKLKTAIDDQSEWIGKSFVTKQTYERTQEDVKRKLQEILNRGKHVRRGDEPGADYSSDRS